MQALAVPGICHAVIMNPTQQFRKDKILINSRPLDKELQGNCVYPPGVKALSVFWWLLKVDKVTVFVLSAPHTMIFMCLIPDNPSRAGNAMVINQAAIFAEIRDTKLTRYDRYGELKVGGSAAAGQIETIYAICTHYQTMGPTDHNENAQRHNIHQTHANSPWQTGGGPSICSLSPSRHVRISLPTKVKPGRHEYRIMSPVR